MGLFSSKPKPGDTPPADGHKMRGGCSSHDMRGPKRDTFNKANADVIAHNKRMHGGKNKGGYIESVD
ncbi:hypothetical protein [Micromonospora arida]